MPSKNVSVNIDDLIERYIAGETVDELSSAFNVSYSWIRKKIKERGAFRPFDHRVLSDDQAASLVARYMAGETTIQLGSAFGVSARVVCDYLKRAGVSARPHYSGIKAYTSSLDPEQRSENARRAAMARLSSMSEEERASIAVAAHNAWRGQHHTEETKLKSSAIKEMKARPDSPQEELVAKALADSGISFCQQAAIGPYNVDFSVIRNENGVSPIRIAIEVTSGWAICDSSRKNWRKRLAYILNSGWSIYYIWFNERSNIGNSLTDDFVSWVNFLQTLPSGAGQYRVVRCTGEVVASGCGDADELAGVFSAQTRFNRRPAD